ncbi:MAG: tyrosine-type recombinase/integrase [Mycobacteriaceae bacterium]
MPAKKRRQYGTGSVYKRASDGRYIAKIQAGWNPNGTRRTLTVSGKTEAEAKAKLKDKQREIAKDGLPAAGVARSTVKAWADQWLPAHATAVRPTTYETDAGAIRKWIVPTIGHRLLADLTPGDVRALHRSITGAGKTSTTARQAHWTLMGMLKAAMLEGHQVPSRVLLVEAPTKATNDRDAIPVEDGLKVLRVIATRPDRARWLVGMLGMRQSECLGLTRDCVDLKAGVLDVSWQLQPLRYLDKSDHSKGFRIPYGFEARHLTHAYHLTRPKTNRGQRIIPLVSLWAITLAETMARPADNPWGLLWTGTDERNGQNRVTPRRSASDREQWHAILDEAGARHPSGRYWHLHEMRHMAATLLLEAKVDPETVKSLLGHSSIVTSRGYQHVSQDLARKALESVAGRLELDR